MDSGSTAFIMVSAALVMLMTPGLALFYAGMARGKNVLGTLMQNFICLALATLVWVLWGYSLSFGKDIGSIIGGLNHLGLAGVGMEPLEGQAIPHQVFMIFQCMFAIITPALMTGAFAERVKFSAFLALVVLWLTLVYAPMCHWVWGGGWMAKMGALDFAGGAVVHMSSGASALAAIIVIGKRRGYGTDAFIPHNLPMTITGAGLLWFGWFGFNAGSALAANGAAGNAFVTTHVATAAATLSWVVVEWLHRKQPTTLGAASGAVAGLVAVTPAAGFVGPMSALLIGLGAGAVCYGGILLKSRFRYDDSLDVVGIHGVGGAFGALCTGLFAQKAIGGTDGLFFGNPAQFGIQAVSVVATILFCFIMTFIIVKVIDAVIGLRVSDEDEVKGLDLSLHSETGYNLT